MFFLCFSLGSLFGGSKLDISKIITGNWSITISGIQDPESYYIRQNSDQTFALQNNQNETITKIPYNFVDMTTLKFTYEATEFNLNFSSHLEAKGTFGDYFIHISTDSAQYFHVVVQDKQSNSLFNLDFTKIDLPKQNPVMQYLPMVIMGVFFIGAQFLSKKLEPKMQQEVMKAQQEQKAKQQKKVQPKVTEVKEGEEKEETEEKEASEEPKADEDKQEKPDESEGKVE
ncbi:hypothetical protein TVAG_334480 [Trichomonas vaginalis G3]|uniref:Uncharacterized protein n=1 Tax=Trichomonas vaginalis (strain ATCC PRA-98 / G3) TaxID=412133 RepID=A2FQS4_TRIV3|nr:hypothetical protein TVAGG3_0479000 [Trichomonas vaginalis G3]EAX92745.1 hypothetical protein TVAG_334480 [Trichomonas vaginalis G3]KAI5515566.1 hypothetical protein TVAGG3_0479000 [Trichomonas vaginalis G3]|eukprot:XP_001305675.1 hypothetical protein [Trichomonas vaginalis G3]